MLGEAQGRAVTFLHVTSGLEGGGRGLDLDVALRMRWGGGAEDGAEAGRVQGAGREGGVYRPHLLLRVRMGSCSAPGAAWASPLRFPRQRTTDRAA